MLLESLSMVTLAVKHVAPLDVRIGRSWIQFFRSLPFGDSFFHPSLACPQRSPNRQIAPRRRIQSQSFLELRRRFVQFAQLHQVSSNIPVQERAIGVGQIGRSVYGVPGSFAIESGGV